MQLVGADVDRDAQRGGGGIVAPLRKLGAGRAQHRAAERQDQSGGLGQRDEAARLQQAALRMRPAHQRLDADQLALQVDLRLVVQQQLAGVDGGAQVGLQRGARGDHGLHFGLEEAHPVAAGDLGLRQRDVGVLEHVLDGLLRIGEQRDADAGGTVVRRVVEHARLGDGVEQALRQRRRLALRLGGGQRQLGDQEAELVGADPRCPLALVQAGRDALGDRLQPAVADVMAAGVVERLEAVKVEHQQRTLAAAPGTLDQRFAQAVEQLLAVGQVGERIEPGELVDLRQQQVLLGDVGGDRAQRGDTAGAVAQRQLDREERPRLAAPAQPLGLLQRDAFAALDHLEIVAAQDRRCLGVEEILVAAAEHALGRRAEHLADLLVDVAVAQPRVLDEDVCVDAVEDGRQALFAGAQRMRLARHLAAQQRDHAERRQQQPERAGGQPAPVRRQARRHRRRRAPTPEQLVVG